ncbi:hypothetical protein F2Q68_00005732 [Brassica cretica]|uniref:Uncharacterized protein n=1 Tax=Brassica cretica TaxID=69181 RepID=A0A8S9JAJ2_BRACR|nr:hypothetical protein F2Q68_00005732 [Brassica cretica]
MTSIQIDCFNVLLRLKVKNRFITSCALLQLLVWIKVEQQCEVNSTLDRAIFIISQVFRPRIGDSWGGKVHGGWRRQGPWRLEDGSLVAAGGGKAHGCWKRGKAMEEAAAVFFFLGLDLV